MKGKKTGGRQAGTPNKVTSAAKSAIEQAAEGIGGVERLKAWVREDPLNERAFWTQIYTKLLPLQVSGDPDQPLMPSAISIVFQEQKDAENQT